MRFTPHPAAVPRRAWFTSGMTNHPTWLASTLIGLLALSGCASSTPATTTSDAPASGASSGAAAAPSSSTPGSVSSSAVKDQTSSGEIVGQRTATADGNTFTLRIHPLQRSGQTVTLNVDLVVDSASRRSVARLDLLADQNDVLSKSKGTTNGFGLVDGRGQKLYMPATTSNNPTSAVCSPRFPGLIATGDVISISCTYAAIPESLTSVTVNAPTFGAFPNVPIR